jgi:hypothetical protein
VLALLIGACGNGGKDDDFPEVVTLGKGEVFPSILNSSLAVGPNRLVIQLTGVDDEYIFGADVSLRFFDLTGDKPRQTAQTTARWVPVELSYVDEQSGGARESAGESGAYIASADFDHSGDWGVKVAVRTTDGRDLEEAPFRFTVRDGSAEPSIGDPAPRSTQATTATVDDIEEIDSSYPPRPQMHDMTLAEAIDTGKPVVVAFATPAYCRSRTCAPVMETVMDPLAERYGGRAVFVHIEPYVLRDLREGNIENPVPATREWRLESEPWVFVIGRDGRIAAKFEGIVGADEVESALTQALG